MKDPDQYNQDENLANPEDAVTPPPSQAADLLLEQTASPVGDNSAVDGTAPTVGSQPRNEVMNLVDSPTTNPGGSCLYFLVCADTTGDLAGLFKLGTTHNTFEDLAGGGRLSG